jgi:hypothetical protein
MYQSLFGFENREAQLRAIGTKTGAAKQICSHQSCNDISSPPPPSYSKLAPECPVAVAMTFNSDNPQDSAGSP